MVYGQLWRFADDGTLCWKSDIKQNISASNLCALKETQTTGHSIFFNYSPLFRDLSVPEAEAPEKFMSSSKKEKKKKKKLAFL